MSGGELEESGKSVDRKKKNYMLLQLCVTSASAFCRNSSKLILMSLEADHGVQLAVEERGKQQSNPFKDIDY